ncbi:uncharacterized protein A1O9_06162 [Exophiala aquamarina CBS 119918]|uniref:N-acetyltransferase domain-containing protein n=1 Tax=Exophiala aquamarina CBS 119918 TaxID=1182545 RepID=A0A072PEG9_9EURO|nr:uncharacterized protein A1O9_06162 [Exophiala aquamarina CBS 119918]KEF58236.1 hypothetical protein A1O9_06162 [Exophiala aquamarina CBS 119918]
MASNPDITIHRIDPYASPETVQQILDLAMNVFDAMGRKRDHHSTIETWMNHLNVPKSFILYATKPNSTEPIGFIFSFMRQQPFYDSPTLQHWVVVIAEIERGKGVFRTLMVESEKHARELGVETLGMACYPGKFKRMAEILPKLEGWELLRWEDEGNKNRWIKPL